MLLEVYLAEIQKNNQVIEKNLQLRRKHLKQNYHAFQIYNSWSTISPNQINDQI